MQHDNYFDSLRAKEAREEAARERRENAILKVEIVRLKKLFLDTLPHKLRHGDADHRKWLDEAVIAVWNGDEPPVPYGKANWEAERGVLRDLVAKAKGLVAHDIDCDSVPSQDKRCDCGLGEWLDALKALSPDGGANG